LKLLANFNRLEEVVEMNRRQMVILPGVAALAASRGFAQTEEKAVNRSSSGTLSHKAVSHYSRPKGFYTIPKNDAKQAKYLSFLTTMLSLTSSQRSQAASIFSSASASDAILKKSLKTARQSLGESVRNIDAAAINKTSTAIGTLAGQRHTIGASANAAFFQLLTADQQAKLNQFRS
jgi:hypothetical protein